MSRPSADRRRRAAALALLAVAAASCGDDAAVHTAVVERTVTVTETVDRAAPPARPAGSRATVARVVDGDTLELRGGERVRLLQVDTPELGEGECYSRAAARALAELAPPGAAVRLVRDPALDARDRYGRLLRYVVRDGADVNLELVRRGAAAPYFFGGERGRHAARLLAAARSARAARRGLWGACPAARLDPARALGTDPAPSAGAGGRCDPSYPGVCIPPPPPDLDCADIRPRDFTVRPPDPHRFDGGGDGIGCET